jgi:hypothetical protein
MMAFHHDRNLPSEHIKEDANPPGLVEAIERAHIFGKRSLGQPDRMICLTEISPSVGWRRGKMRDRHLVVSPGSPNVETVPAMLPNLEAAERDEKCVWCGRTREDHEESREPGADVSRMPCLGLRKYYKGF